MSLLDASPSVPNAEQPPQPPALATPPKSKLVTSVRSLMMHRILRKGKGVTAEELSTKLLADVKLVATRLALLGSDAICDSPADLEWLADKAFDLGIECIAASGAGAATDTASGGATEGERLEAVDDDALRRSTEFVSASCELRERLPGSDEHLQRLMRGQMVLCRGCVLLAKRRLPAEQRTLLLTKAAKAIEVAFRAYGRTARSRGQLGERRGPAFTVPCTPRAPLSARAPRASARHFKGLCCAPLHHREPHPLNNVTRPHGLGFGRRKQRVRVRPPCPQPTGARRRRGRPRARCCSCCSSRWVCTATTRARACGCNARPRPRGSRRSMSTGWASSASSSARAGLHRRPGLSCDTASHMRPPGCPEGFVQVRESGLGRRASELRPLRLSLLPTPQG